MILLVALLMRTTVVLALGLTLARWLSPKGPAYVVFACRAAILAGAIVIAFSFVPVPESAFALRVPLAPEAAPISGPATEAARTATAPAVNVGQPTLVPAKPTPIPSKPLSAQEMLFALWALGAAALLLRLALAQASLIRLRAKSTDPTLESFELLSRFAFEAHVRPPSLATHGTVETPFLAGIVSPTIYLPSKLDGPALEAVLRHELIHLKNRDCAYKLAERLICCALWPNPLAWMLCRALDEATEELCDQTVVQSGWTRAEYAKALLDLARQDCRPGLAFVLASGVVDFRSTVGKRISRILDASLGTATAVGKNLRLAAVPLAALAAVGTATMISAQSGRTTTESHAKARASELGKLKLVSLSLLMYANDYDDVYPYVDTTATIKRVLDPYLASLVRTQTARQGEADTMPGLRKRIQETWNTGNPAQSQFLFNRCLGGGTLSQIEDPARTIAIYDSKVWPDDSSRMVGFVDGHVKSVGLEQWALIEPTLHLKIYRTAKKPLPDNLPYIPQP